MSELTDIQLLKNNLDELSELLAEMKCPAQSPFQIIGGAKKIVDRLPHPTNDAKKVPDSAHGALPITREYALSIGFKEQPIFTIDHGIYYDVGRRRTLNIGDVGTPNEMLYLCETNEDGDTQENDVIVLHNYDYDGQLSDAKLNKIISFFEVCKSNEQEDEENE